MQEVIEHSVQKIVRVRKEDCVYAYWILESHEGLTAYSTMAYQPSDPYRNLLLNIPKDFQTETEKVLELLSPYVTSVETLGLV